MDLQAMKMLRQDLKFCSMCNLREAPTPEFLTRSLPTAKVMLLTMSPTFQLIYKSLSSVRFFRTLCLALFGFNPKIENLIEHFFRGIYWTHYHKCYYSKVFKDKNFMLPSFCSDTYLKREINLVSPRLIVVLGKPVIRALFNDEMESGGLLRKKFVGIESICADFPITGCEPEFKEIRILLSKYIDAIDVSDVPGNIKSRNLASRGKTSVHADFELNCLETYLKQLFSKNGLQPISSDCDIDKTWYEKQIIPQWQRYSFILTCVSVLEDQISPLAKEKKVVLSSPGKSKIMEAIEKLFEDHKQKLVQEQSLFHDLSTLIDVRNDIVHNGGRVKSFEWEDNTISGIDDVFGMIQISEEGCTAAFDIVKRVTKLIRKLEE